MSGTIYLLHFDPPYRHARYDLGYTQDLDARLAAHRSGRGSPLIRAAAAAGVTFTVVRTWPGGRVEERRLHRMHDSPARLCPICRALGAR
jgi:hypothetical protein